MKARLDSVLAVETPPITEPVSRPTTKPKTAEENFASVKKETSSSEDDEDMSYFPKLAEDN